MVLVPPPKITLPEYFVMDLETEGMLEYYDGSVVAKGRSSTLDHSYISSFLLPEIGMFLKDKDCYVAYYKLRAATPSGNAYMYPDLTITCGLIELKEDCFDTLTNPSVILEIMTDASRDRDMGAKFWYSLQIPTLNEYILLDSTRCHVMTIRRKPGDLWQFGINEDIDSSLAIATVGLELPLKEIYRKVSWATDISK